MYQEIPRQSHSKSLGGLQKEWTDLKLSDSQLRTVVRKLDLVRLEILRLRASLLPEEELNEKEKKELEEARREIEAGQYIKLEQLLGESD